MLRKWVAFLSKEFKGYSGFLGPSTPLAVMATSESDARKKLCALIGSLDKRAAPIDSLPRRTIVIRKDRLDAKGSQRQLL